MFEQSQASLFESIADLSMSSLGALLVNQPASPAGAGELPTIAGSGLSFCAWCLKSLRCGCWRRTLAECFLSTLREWGSVNGLHFSLRISDTRSSPSFLLLQTSGRLTTENEFGLWPTARATDAEKGGPNQRGSKGDLMLPSAVMKWASPIAGDADGSRTSKGKNRPGECGLAGQVKKWSTPTATYVDKKADANMRRPAGLEAQVRMWGTPTARDWKSIHAGDETLAANSRPLSEQVGQWARETNSGNGKSRESFHLNPRWELQLMGMPADWLDGVEPE